MSPMPPIKVNIRTLQKQKDAGERITMLTAYDFAMARILDDAGVDLLLVGDSWAWWFKASPAPFPSRWKR